MKVNQKFDNLKNRLSLSVLSVALALSLSTPALARPTNTDLVVVPVTLDLAQECRDIGKGFQAAIMDLRAASAAGEPLPEEVFMAAGLLHDLYTENCGDPRDLFTWTPEGELIAPIPLD